MAKDPIEVPVAVTINEELNTALVVWLEARRKKEQLGQSLAAAEREFTKANVAEREAYAAVDELLEDPTWDRLTDDRTA